MSDRKITTLDKLNLLTDFLERKGLWEGAYPLDESNFNMKDIIVSEDHPCGTIGCIAGHMGKDKIWNSMGLFIESLYRNFILYSVKKYSTASALKDILGITIKEVYYIFYSWGLDETYSVEAAIKRINKVKDNYK